MQLQAHLYSFYGRSCTRDGPRQRETRIYHRLETGAESFLCKERGFIRDAKVARISIRWSIYSKEVEIARIAIDSPIPRRKLLCISKSSLRSSIIYQGKRNSGKGNWGRRRAYERAWKILDMIDVNSTRCFSSKREVLEDFF